MTYFPGEFSDKQNQKKKTDLSAPVDGDDTDEILHLPPLMQQQWCYYDGSEPHLILNPVLFKYSYARKPNQNGISFYLYFLLQSKMKPSITLILINKAQNSKEKLNTKDLSHSVTLCLHIKIKFYFKLWQQTPPAQ